ncbi:MAG TPA: ABC transporter permease [Candidatus Methylacidiphilales bacterium]|nr:ABC transporter permease [Candidatus Methylacidiphilales bacterium]
MRFLLGISQGFKEIWAHKFRSILTMLGIILGVASLMAMFAMTAGIANGTREFIVAIGGVEKVEIRDTEPPPAQENIAEISPGRTYQDAIALRKSTLVAAVSPTVDLSGAKLTRMNLSSRPTVTGAEWPFLEVENHEVELGRFITDMDMELGNRVVVLGRNVVDELWTEPNMNPVGEYIKINGFNFKVVGVFKRYVRASTERMKGRTPSALAVAATNHGVTPDAQPIFRRSTETGTGTAPAPGAGRTEVRPGAGDGTPGGQGQRRRRQRSAEGTDPAAGGNAPGDAAPAGAPADPNQPASTRRSRTAEGAGAPDSTAKGPNAGPGTDGADGQTRQRRRRAMGEGGDTTAGGAAAPGGQSQGRQGTGSATGRQGAGNNAPGAGGSRDGTPTSSTFTSTRSQDPSQAARRANRGDPFAFKNRAVVIPITTMQQIFKSVKPNATNSSINEGADKKLTRLTARVTSFETFEDALSQMRNILLLTHRGIEDFTFDTRLDQFDRMESSVAAVRLSGGIIAGISLLVGGLGITNIMLASITERVREIGIRRAVGARGVDIFLQILIEGVVLSFLGGVLGLAAGAGLVSFLEFIVTMDNAPVIEFSSIIVSLTYAIVVGVFAGFYPAYKAAQLSPLQALRYE